MEKLKHKLNSVRIKLFLTLGLAVIVIIVVLILLNNVVLETFYLFSKQNTLKNVYEKVNADYKNLKDTTKIEEDLKKIAIRNNFDIFSRRIYYFCSCCISNQNSCCTIIICIQLHS